MPSASLAAPHCENKRTVNKPKNYYNEYKFIERSIRKRVIHSTIDP